MREKSEYGVEFANATSGIVVDVPGGPSIRITIFIPKSIKQEKNAVVFEWQCANNGDLELFTARASCISHENKI